MKLNVELNSEKHEIEVRRDGRKVFARVDDREYELDVSEVEPSVYLLKDGAKIYQVYAAPNGIVNVGNRQIELALVDPKKLRGSGAESEDQDGVAEIRTAMPGKLVRILVSASDEVKHGDAVLVVEAMKMQNEMKSPKDGVVREIKFVEGDNVNAGDVLAVIE